jgi:hypothetical protein
MAAYTSLSFLLLFLTNTINPHFYTAKYMYVVYHKPCPITKPAVTNVDR